MNFFKCLIISVLLSSPSLAAAEGCTIDIPTEVIQINAGALGLSYYYGQAPIFVTCPAGQAWTLSVTNTTNGRMYVYNGSKYFDQTTCRPGYTTTCNFNSLSTGMPLASGAGTGSPQEAFMLTTSAFPSNTDYTGTGSPFFYFDFKVQDYGPTTSPQWFKVSSGGVDATAALTSKYIITQTCSIMGTTNMTFANTGAADTAGSFVVNYACGYGTVPAITMSINGGLNQIGETRRAVKSGGYIGYHLFWDSGYTQEIGVTSNNSVTLPTSPPYGSKTVYGKVLVNDPVNSTKGNGAYVDTLTVGIDF